MSDSIRCLWALLLCITVPALTTACVTRVPDSLGTVGDAFPHGQRSQPPSDAPSDATKRSIYPAPFEDVFRAAEVSASQVQFNVEEIDYERGLILATRTIRAVNPNTGVTNQVTQQYTYGIWVQELGPESTRVDVSAKFQSECEYTSAMGWALVSICTIGIALPTALIGYPIEKSRCSKASTLQWATKEYDSLQEMSQLLTFIRNNLIAAGAM